MPFKTKKQSDGRQAKKSYSSPLLHHFGSIKELTSGGTGLMAEMGMKGAAMLNRHP